MHFYHAVVVSNGLGIKNITIILNLSMQAQQNHDYDNNYFYISQVGYCLAQTAAWSGCIVERTRQLNKQSISTLHTGM